MNKVLILDDHKIILDQVGKYIADNIDVQIETAQNIEEFQEKVNTAEFFIIDFSLEEGTGFDALDILSKYKKQNVIIFTSNIDPGIIRHLFKHKLVKGIVHKASDGSELLEAIKALQEGKDYFCTKSNMILNSNRRSYFNLDDEEGELTAREREVLDYMWNNYSTEGIAHKLGISPHTVESHRKNIKRKLGADSLISMIKIGLEKGYINTFKKL